jgi:hypothetical protein
MTFGQFFWWFLLSYLILRVGILIISYLFGLAVGIAYNKNMLSMDDVLRLVGRK